MRDAVSGCYLECSQLFVRLINNCMKHKYSIIGRPQGSKGNGRCSDPETWKTGPDPLRREIYYAWLKHKSQAQYRGETYNLTWKEWEHMWSNGVWEKRGRKINDLCLTRLDFDGAWCMSNVIICTRQEHFKIKRQLNAQKQSI